MKLTPIMVTALTATADLLETLIEQQKAGPGRGYSKPRVIECSLWDACDAGGESVDSFDFEDGEAEALIEIIREAVSTRPEGGKLVLATEKGLTPIGECIAAMEEMIAALQVTDDYPAQEKAEKRARAALAAAFGVSPLAEKRGG